MSKANSQSQLEYKILFAVIVAGKSANFARDAMERFRHAILSTVGHNEEDSYFRAIRRALTEGLLDEIVRRARVGNYTKVARAFQEIVNAELNLRTCTIEELEAIHGIGMKTSRFFLRWSGRRERVAVLDVHILRWLAEQGYPNVPKSTPSSKFEYTRLENAFLQHADKLGIHPADLDEQLWLKLNTSGIRS